MKTRLLCCAGAIAITTAPAFAQDERTPDTPAGETAINPEPSLEEELVYLRDQMALQTLRLDEAEQVLTQQTEVIQAQAAMLAELQRVVAGIRANANFASAPQGGVYTVKRGDTLFAIARRYGATIREIARANNIDASDTLRIGQQLNIPGLKPTEPQAALAQADQLTAPPPKSPQEPAQPAERQRVADAAAARSRAPERQQVASRADAEGGTREQEPQPGRSQQIEEVGIRPEEEEERPYLAVFSDIGGILTPKGTMFVEPAIDFTTSSDNRFFFQGIEIVDAVLIGAIEATDADRRALTESFGFRYGLTNRLEIDGRISHVQRDDRIAGVAIDETAATLTRDLSGNGIGDAEFGLHYQLNDGIKLPYAIANVRVKAPTGESPFEVARDPVTFLETELATGSGFWTVEPSMTFIVSSDPAVIFANFGYQANLSTSPDARVSSGSTLLELDPGDAIRTSAGVGISLNERLSVNFAYDQSYFLKTESLIQSIDPASTLPILDMSGEPIITRLRQPSVTVGSFLFGASYSLTDRLRLNFSSAIGATDEAPDARVNLRMQYRLFD